MNESTNLIEKIKTGKKDLSEADLSRADLSRADFSGADFSGANLSGADLGKVKGISSMQEEMQYLRKLRDNIRLETFRFKMSKWHSAGSIEGFDSDFEKLIHDCGTTHCGAGFCQVLLAREQNPAALLQTPAAGSFAIPSMARYFFEDEDKFLARLDDLIEGRIPQLKR